MRSLLLALAVAVPAIAQAQCGHDDRADDLRRELQYQWLDESSYRNQMLSEQQEEINALRRINRNLARIANERRHNRDDSPADLFDDDESVLEDDSLFDDDYP